MERGERGAPTERAQSEVLGTVLLLGLTVAVVGTTVALGGAALDDAQRTADLQRVEGAMTQLDSKASLVAHGGSPSQRVRVDVGRSAGLRVDEGAGWLRIEVSGGENGTYANRIALGAIVYERGGSTVAYQGGGVWRSNGDGGSEMVSPPEFHYRGTDGPETLTLPLVTIENGSGRLGDTVRITESASGAASVFPNADYGNPLSDSNVTVEITVQSEYADAWGRFFESRTNAAVAELDDDRVRILLRTATVHPTLSASVSATGRSELQMGDVDWLYADSYNSSNGTYGSQTPGDGASIQTRGDFALTKGGGGNTETVRIRGNLTAESYNIPPGQSAKLNVSGERRIETAFDQLAPVEGGIRQRIDGVRERNLADNAPNQSTGIDLSGDETLTIDENTYVDGDVSVSERATLRVTDGATIHVAGSVTVEGDETATLDVETGSGNVTVLVDEGLDLSGSASVRASGGGRAELYVDDSITVQGTASIATAENTRLDIYNTGDIDLNGPVTVAADGDVASNLWLYSSGDEVEMAGGEDDGDRIRFTGVFYAPQSDVELEDGMTIKGSFTFRRFSFDDGDIEIHYDEALRTHQPFDGETVPVVSYLHVSTHGVVVESD
ncbi:hypothetical protein [Halorubrum sp. SP9]|uniref:DUF7289 family protein n=1 Tax=Halorubrum sp. SP9 TaxID=1537267 RepID=UPI0010F710A1|nr:hypothetical protein [Halorubrum sp. SP9]TKX71469.1 hypothetical protein EXE45_00935 [Halorubrum sp. SP9]